MSYLVTREGRELGTYKTSKIEKGLKTGLFRLSDLGWHEASGWQGLFEIVGSDNAAAPLSSPAAMNPDSLNPYSVSAANPPPENSGLVPLSVTKELTATRPWVRFISVVMWIAFALLLLFMAGGIYLASTSVKTDGNMVELPTMMITISICYGFAALLLIYPTLKLSRYASKISRLSESGTFTFLSAALAEQRRFWKFSGILAFLYVCLILLLLVGSLFVTRVK